MPAAGDYVNATDIVVVKYCRKTTTDSIASSTTATADAHIVFDLDADKVYKIDLHAHASCGIATADIKFVWALTGGVAALTTRQCFGPGTSVADVTAAGTVRMARHSLTTNVPYGLDGTSSSGIWETFLVETTTSGTSGTLTLQWAQNTSQTTPTQLTSATFATATVVEQFL